MALGGQLSADIRDAVNQRTVALVLGVLLLQLGFIFSYVAAFHSPRPHRVPIAVVAPPHVAQRVIATIDRIPGTWPGRTQSPMRRPLALSPEGIGQSPPLSYWPAAK